MLRKADSVSRNLSHTSEQLADEGAETLAEHTAEALSVFRHSAGTLGAAITTLSDNAGDVSKTLTDTCAGLTRVEQARRQALEIGNALAVMTSSGRHQTPSPAVRDAILQFMVSRYTMAAERAVHNRCTGSQLEVKEAEGAAFPQEEEDHDLDAILF